MWTQAGGCNFRFLVLETEAGGSRNEQVQPPVLLGPFPDFASKVLK
jgi:hypothetical protein